MPSHTMQHLGAANVNRSYNIIIIIKVKEQSWYRPHVILLEGSLRAKATLFVGGIEWWLLRIHSTLAALSRSIERRRRRRWSLAMYWNREPQEGRSAGKKKIFVICSGCAWKSLSRTAQCIGKLDKLLCVDTISILVVRDDFAIRNLIWNAGVDDCGNVEWREPCTVIR